MLVECPCSCEDDGTTDLKTCWFSGAFTGVNRFSDHQIGYKPNELLGKGPMWHVQLLCKFHSIIILCINLFVHFEVEDNIKLSNWSG